MNIMYCFCTSILLDEPSIFGPLTYICVLAGLWSIRFVRLCLIISVYVHLFLFVCVFRVRLRLWTVTLALNNEHK